VPDPSNVRGRKVDLPGTAVPGPVSKAVPVPVDPTPRGAQAPDTVMTRDADDHWARLLAFLPAWARRR